MSTATPPPTEPPNPVTGGRWREYFTVQRVIVISFAVVEAAVLGWAIGCVILRDAAR